MKEITVNDSRMYGLMVLYDMHTGFFKRAIEGIAHEAANNRLDTQANHVAWLTGSLVQQRYEAANLFGRQMQQAAHGLFRDYQGIKDDVTYPPLAEFLQDWEKVSPVVRDIFVKLDATQLDAEYDMEGMKMTYYELISFMAYREASCIGQIALWRRLLGYPPLRYDDMG
ncbi:MAG TPA: hypothetical protein VGB50_09795 [Flavobacterium sp.]|jgi:hypothetical protein